MPHTPLQHARATSGCEPHPARRDFSNFVESPAFPCVGAKSANSRNRLRCSVFDKLGTEAATQRLWRELQTFSEEHPDPGLVPVSFAAVFLDDAGDAPSFHDRLWRQLQLLHEWDACNFDWAPGVSADPSASDFSFSVARRAFFVVGLHPRSARLARRAPHPTLVFNFHDQFEAMKAAGLYQKLQRTIRARDIALQGDVNPSLTDFGLGSEARQYSGHLAGGCPFHARKRVDHA